MVLCCSFWNNSRFVFPSNAVHPDRLWFRTWESMRRLFGRPQQAVSYLCAQDPNTAPYLAHHALPPANCVLKINVLSHNLLLSGSPITVLWSVGSLILCVLQSQIIPDEGTTHGRFHYVLFLQAIPLFARTLISWETKLHTETKTCNIMILYWYLTSSEYYTTWSCNSFPKFRTTYPSYFQDPTENYNDITGIRPLDHPICSAVSQLSSPPRASFSDFQGCRCLSTAVWKRRGGLELAPRY